MTVQNYESRSVATRNLTGPRAHQSLRPETKKADMNIDFGPRDGYKEIKRSAVGNPAIELVTARSFHDGYSE